VKWEVAVCARCEISRLEVRGPCVSAAKKLSFESAERRQLLVGTIDEVF
jgi:hypothetical protein